MSYSPEKITAAARIVHNNYSETDYDDADSTSKIWARGTVRAVFDTLGDSQEHEHLIEQLEEANRHKLELRAMALEFGEQLTRIWQAAGRNDTEGFGTDAGLVYRAVVDAIEAARVPRDQVEVTDAMVESLGAQVFDPSVVWDREKVRLGLANALQTS